MYYHITSLTNDIIASNLPPELWSEANRCVNVSVSELCPIKNKKKRHGVILSDEIRLYLCTYDENITNKIFKRYQETAAFLVSVRYYQLFIVPPTTPPTGLDNYTFETTCKIYVPLSAVSSYKYRESWSKYASQIEGYDFE